MLQPKRVKFRKPHRPRIRKIAQRGYTLISGTFGLKALTGGRITARQLEAVRVALTRTMKREGAIYRRISPTASYTAKPLEVRMGKGKGAPAYFAALVHPGTILYELEGVPHALAEKACNNAKSKLPIKAQMIFREDYKA